MSVSAKAKDRNKLFGAILLAGVTTMAISIATNLALRVKPLERNVYQIAGITPPPAATPAPAAPPAAAAAPTVEPIGPLLASANVEAGGRLFQAQCQSCHTPGQGGRNGVGPNLWGVVGGPKAHAQGFNYSSVLREAAARPGDAGRWGFEELNAFVASPSGYLPRTRMAYPGMRSVQDRANLIAWLRQQAATPVPLPN